MYTVPSTDAATTRFWSAWSARMRQAGLDAPHELTTGKDSEAIWTDPDLLVSQTCGYPYVKNLVGKAQLVATPHYGAEGCDGSNYHSWLVAGAGNAARTLEELRGSRAAYTGTGSHSGYNCFRAIVAPLANGNSFFSETIQSGGHAASMQLIADGKADCATIDCVSWALTLRDNPSLGEKLKRITATPSVPGLPFITSATRSEAEIDAIRTALFDTLADASLKADLEILLLKGASILTDIDYDACREMETSAVGAGYPILV